MFGVQASVKNGRVGAFRQRNAHGQLFGTVATGALVYLKAERAEMSSITKDPRKGEETHAMYDM